MEVLLNKKSATEASISVKISSDDYNTKVDKAIKDVALKANLKGFRPGKVPPQLIQKMYGKGILIDEVNNLLADTVSNYIRDNKLQVVGDPHMDTAKAEAIDWNTQKEFDFSYDLGLASDFEVNLSAIPAVKSYTISIGDKAVNETIENLQQQFGEQIHVETIEDGDMVYGELKQGEFSTKTAIPFRQIKDDAKDKFVGVAKGATITFDIRNTFVDDRAVKLLSGLQDEEAAALNGDFEFVVEDITRKGVAEVNQEFFDKVLGEGDVSNEADFKTKIAEIVSENYTRETAALLNRHIEDALLDNIAIELPEQFLKDWLLRINEGKVTSEQIETEFDAFTKSLKLSLIKTRIAETNELKVEYADVVALAEAQVRSQFGGYISQMGEEGDKMVSKIAQNYLTEGGKTENFNKLYNEVQDQKVIEYCKANISTLAEDVDFEQFKEIVDKLNK